MGFRWVEIYHSSERRNAENFLNERGQFRDLKHRKEDHNGSEGSYCILFRVRDIANTVTNPKGSEKETILFSTLNASYATPENR
jgi:hypothetical protein